MSKKAQGTRLWFIDPDDDSIVEIDCVLNIDGPNNTVEQIETTCLADEFRTYVAGIGTPGQLSFSINTDPSNASHVRLHALYKAKTSLSFAIGWSDGTDAPTFETDGVFELPATRSWITFEGFVTNFPFSFAQNAVVNSQLTVQISGDEELTPKTA